MSKIQFWTDGAYSSKKEKGGWAFYCPQYRLRLCHSESNTTNNRMELTAAIKALEFVSDSNLEEKEVEIFSDSMYLVETMNGKYKAKTNLDLWHKLNSLHDELFDKHISYMHVKGHADCKENNISDLLANLVSQI